MASFFPYKEGLDIVPSYTPTVVILQAMLVDKLSGVLFITAFLKFAYEPEIICRRNLNESIWKSNFSILKIP